MTTRTSRYMRDGAWLIATRLLTLTVGIAGLPILMSSLGSLQFGAWAVLLGGTFAFGTLELGMSSAVMRWTTLAAADRPGAMTLSVGDVMSNAMVCSLGIFAIAGLGIWAIADPLAAWLNLPTTPLLTPGDCVLLVFGCVGVIALLRLVIALMFTYRRFKTYAAVTVAQSLVSAGATWSVALNTGRLDLVLIVNAAALIAVQLFAAIWFSRQHPWRFSRGSLSPKTMWAMLRHGAALQFSDLSTFVMFQFDKLLIAAMVTPAEVAHYEVASRATQALGSLPSTSFKVVVPDLIDHFGRGGPPHEQLVSLLRFTLLGTAVFLLLPIAVAPIGLFAWVGQVGYHAAGVFLLLALAITSNVLVMPFNIYLQAVGRVELELRRAMTAAAANIPLSVLLIGHLGKEGAALGTLIACLGANPFFAIGFQRNVQVPLNQMVRGTASITWPIACTVGLIGCAAWLIEPLVITSRWRMAPAAAGLYACGLVLLATLLMRTGTLTARERERLLSVPGLSAVLRRLQRG